MDDSKFKNVGILSDELMQKYARLQGILRDYGSVAVAFSGGKSCSMNWLAISLKLCPWSPYDLLACSVARFHPPLATSVAHFQVIQKLFREDSDAFKYLINIQGLSVISFGHLKMKNREIR